MALFGSISDEEVDQFAKSLAQEIAAQYPPAVDAGREKAAADKPLTRIIEEACNRALAFKNEHKLGMYKKARLGNTFRCELEALGYGNSTVETATEGLVVYLTRRS